MFIDTETTGSEEEDRLCQVAFEWGALQVNDLYKPPLPISTGAMAVHHITNRMVEDKPPFIGSYEYAILSAAKEDAVFVAHNAPFDLKMLAKEGLEFDKVIDTLKVIRYLDEAAKCESYSLQYLRYHCGMEVEAQAHDAWGDILVLKELFKIMSEILMDREALDGPDDVIDRMIAISAGPVPIVKFNFGKHKGKTVEEVAREDRGYLGWLQREKLKSPEGEEDWLYTLERVLK